MDGVTLVPLAGLSDDARAHARAVYESAFPPELSADFDSLFVDEVLAAVEGDRPERVAALIVLRRLDPAPWAFVRYLVAADRGRGAGSATMAALLDLLGPDVGVVLDVEHPDEDGVDETEREVRRRRVTFYERNGLHVLPASEYRPPHGDHAPPMLLLATSTDDPATIVRTVYAGRYGLEADHAVVVRTLRASWL